MACQCRPAPGGVTVCDECASQMVEALNDLIPEDPQAQQLPCVMTQSEYTGMVGAVNGWLDDLRQGGYRS